MTSDGLCPMRGVPPEAIAQNPADMLLREERQELFDWYIQGGFRGCLFNKLAARDAKRDEFPWHVEVVEGDMNTLIDDEASATLIQKFRDVIDHEKSDAALASFVFPDLTNPEEYAELLVLLETEAPDLFKILPTEDREVLGTGTDSRVFVGIQFRIVLGQTDEGEDIFSYPMIYTPDAFTTFARRYDKFMITFNPHTSKNNPETPETYIGVDDIKLDLSESLFEKLLQRSLDVNRDAHSVSGTLGEGEVGYNRSLFRAHNALVIPAEYWETQVVDTRGHADTTVMGSLGEVALGEGDTGQTDEDFDVVEVEDEAGGGADKSRQQGNPHVVTVSRQKGKRGHPMVQVKRNLSQQGKLNAKKPMPLEQKKARRKKRKR